MKMDIEGGEYEALVGARSLLQKRAIGCTFLELSDWAAERAGHSVTEITSLLQASGYRLCELKAGKLVPVPGERAASVEAVIALSQESDLVV